MRVICTVLAVLMLAACPPRRSRVVYVQPYVAPAAPVVVVPAPPTPEPPARVIDPAVEAILVEWEKRMAGVSNLRTEITIKRTDAVFKKDTNYSGTVLWLKPNFARLRLDNTDDPSKTDYEAYICNGKSIFAYNGLQKTITELKLPLPELLANQLLYRALIEIQAKDVKDRFEITLFKKDDHYLYLDMKPRSDEDKSRFQHIRVALHGPGPAAETFAYLPAQVYVLQANGDSEVWKFSNPQVNLPDLKERDFAFTPIKGWSVKAPPVGSDARP